MNYRVVEETISCMRAAPRMANVDGSWKKEIEEDFRRRSRKGRK